MGSDPLHFVGEPIEVIFSEQPMLEKSPHCPSAIIWRDEYYPVLELLETWPEFGRRGKSSHNMRPEHAAVATKRGSWGVGRFYFRVRVEGNRIFEIYYDRAPKSSSDRKGHWFLKGERVDSPDNPW